MPQAARTPGRWLVKIRRHLTARFGSLKREKPPRASDIIAGMTLAVLLVVLFSRLPVSLFWLE
ncbi:MAG: hypothetical protein VR78_02085 [Hoeflea sp. BRH_c9]|nr:MAG: hypothetical protein VR78_02085 [Hoeflea sp. BRH_c9]